MNARKLADIVIRGAFVLLCCLTVGIRPTVAAADLGKEVTFDIPAQQLPSALLKFATQSGVQITSPGQLIEGKSSSGAIGTFDGREALQRILKDTELRFDVVDENTVMIVPIATQPKAEAAVSSAKPQASNQSTQTTDGVQKKSFSDRFRVAQVDQGKAATDDALEKSEKTSENSEGVQLEEIVVTAQKREERAFDIPMTLNVLGAEEIERKGIEDMGDLAYAAPGLMVQEFGPGRQVIFMRGVGNRVGSSPLTGVYLDEVPITGGTSAPSSIGQIDLRTTDLERVEVLRGPQGTLYGAGAVAGTVRFITADPRLDSFSAYGEATGSFTEDGDPSQKVAAILNMPLATDTFALRLAATYENNGGWIDRPEAGKKDVNGNELTNVRLKGLWRLSDAFDVKATVIASRNRDGDSGGLNHSGADGNFRMAVDRDLEAPFQDDYELLNLTASYDFGGVSLLSSSSYIDHDADFLYTFIGGPETKFNTFEAVYAYDQRVTSFSQEVRLASDNSGALSWTTGVFYQDVDERSDYVLDSVFGALPPFPTVTERTDNWNTSWAVFGDASYKLTDRWTLGAGARYFEDDREQVKPLGQQEGKFDKLTWRVNSSYAIREDVRAYASIATGFRSGGFSSFGFPPYDPETLTAYEVGLKASLPAQRTHVEFALFRNDYKDYLRRGLLLNPDTNVFESAEGNVGDVKIDGAELSISAGLTEALTLSLTGAYTDAALERLDPTASGEGLGQVGDRIDYIPKFSYTAGLNYDFSWGANLPGFVRFDYSYRDKVSVIDRGITLPIMYSDNTALLSARIGIAGERWSVQLFGDNLTNENGSFDPWVFWDQAVRNRPRTYGLKLGYDFK